MTEPHLHIYSSYSNTANPNEIVLIPSYGGGYYTNLNLESFKMNTYLSAVSDRRSSSLNFNPVTGATYYNQLYTQFIINADGRQTKVSGIGNVDGKSADFSYVRGDVNRIYYHYNTWLELMDYNTGTSPFAGSMLSNMWRLTSTINGKHLVCFRRNNETGSFFVFDPTELR